MKGIIYKIVNKINNKIYIGQTIRSLEDRWYYHTYDALTVKCSTKIGRAIRKYGVNSFTVETIEETEELDKREMYWIAFYVSDKKGYNIKSGGSGGPHANSTKTKIAKANRKRVWTEEMRNNMSQAIKKWHEKRGFVPRSKEFKEKISKANMGRKMPVKTKEAFNARNKKSSKTILCLDTQKEYASIMAACRELGLNDGHVRMHLKGKHSHVKGFHFKLVN